MILYIENTEFGKVAGYKINIQKSLAFLYTNNEKSEMLRKQFHSPLKQKNKIVRNKPTCKEMKPFNPKGNQS